MNKRFLRYIFGPLVFFVVFSFFQQTYAEFCLECMVQKGVHIDNATFDLDTRTFTIDVLQTKEGKNLEVWFPKELQLGVLSSDNLDPYPHLWDRIPFTKGTYSFQIPENSSYKIDNSDPRIPHIEKVNPVMGESEFFWWIGVRLVDRPPTQRVIYEEPYHIPDIATSGGSSPSNSVRVNWGAIELQQNSTGQYTYSITSQGNVTRENATAVYLNVSKTSEQNPQDITYYTLCNYETAGLSFAVSYPSCAGSQNVLNAQSGFIYKIYFSDGINSSKIINNPSGGQGIYQLPVVPAGGNNSPGNEPGEPGTTTGEQDPSTTTTTTTTSSEGENPTTTTTTQESDGGLVSKECGYNLSNGGRICGFSDLIGLLDRIIQFIFILAIPIAALVFAYAGFLYLTSGGNTDKHKKAVKAMTTVVKGILVVMVAWLAVKTILVSLGASPDSAWFWLDVK